MTNINITIDDDTTNNQPITKSLAYTLCLKGFLLLKKNVTLNQNIELPLNYGCIDPIEEYEIKLVCNSVHANFYSKECIKEGTAGRNHHPGLRCINCAMLLAKRGSRLKVIISRRGMNFLSTEVCLLVPKLT